MVRMFIRNGVFVGFVLIAAVDAARLFPITKTEAYLGEVPYQVSIRYNGRHTCGGAIISKRHVLTSASCVAEMSYVYKVVVVTGSIDVNQGQTHKVKSIYYHNFWMSNITGDAHDVAVVSLFEKMSYNYYQRKVQLPKNPAPINCIAVVSGWGTRLMPRATMLSRAIVETLSPSECHAALRHNKLQWTNQLCTESFVDVGVCMGDDGAPLVFEDQLIGVVSRGHLCDKEHPNIYTSVYHNLEWIMWYKNNT